MLRKLDTDTPQLWVLPMGGKNGLQPLILQKAGLINVRITFFGLTYDEDFILDFLLCPLETVNSKARRQP
jgi:hypothetical protein